MRTYILAALCFEDKVYNVELSNILIPLCQDELCLMFPAGTS